MNYIKITLLIITLCITKLNAQKNHFTAQNNVLKWTKTLNNTNTKEITKNLVAKGFSITKTDSIINFNNTITTNALIDHGFKRLKFPAYINNTKLSGFITTNKNNTTITVTKIQCQDALNPLLFEDISFFIIKNNQIKSNKTSSKVVNLYNNYLNYIFN